MIRTLLIALSLSITLFVIGQIPPGYYDNAEGLTGDQLKAALHNIIDGHTEYSYNDLRDFILMATDEDPDNPNNIILLYTGRSQNKNTFGGNANDWNREHVWAKSHGNFGETPPCGTDAHHIRPTDASVNSSRGNKDFDMGGVEHTEALGNYYTTYTWEPRDAVKGDVARMIFYMAVRYEGDNGEPDLEVVDWVNTSPNPVFGKYSTLIQWHQQDPPDAFEINRNEVIYSYQHNRNPFIDHPEYLLQIYDPTNGVNESKINQLSIYPNPAKDFISIQVENSDLNNSEISISNIFGNTVYKNTFHENEKIELMDFPSGLYIINVVLDRQIYSQKFQIVR